VLRARLLISEASLYLLLDTFPEKYKSETNLIDFLIKETIDKVHVP